jgi:trehalose-phosphatase
VLIVDYDGTLADVQVLPEQAAPPASLRSLLRRLCALPRTLVYVVCGRDRENLDRWFSVRVMAMLGALAHR